MTENEKHIANLVTVATMNAAIMAFKCGLEGMKAENRHRKINGDSLAYRENEFKEAGDVFISSFKSIQSAIIP